MTVEAARSTALRRARLLNRLTIGWNAVEGVVAVAAGVAAGSVSLIGFGVDSAIEVSAAIVLAWWLSGSNEERRARTDRLAARLVALSFAALFLYVTVEAVTDLATGDEPDASIVGMALAALSLVVMPVLARAKGRVALELGSRAQAAEARQTLLCAWLSAVLLAGLVLNATLGWWWADPVAALFIAATAGREALETWRAESLEESCCP